MDKNTYKSMMDQAVPDSSLIQDTKNKMASAMHQSNKTILKEITSMKKHKYGTAAAVIMALLLLIPTTVIAAQYFLKPSDIAEQFENHALSEAFESESAIEINETIVSGDYSITLLGIVSGKAISDSQHFSDGELKDDRTYAAVAIQKTDGTPWPDLMSDDEFMQVSFFATPLVKGLKPWQVNAATMNGGSVTSVYDGILYRIVDCDDVTMFADRGLYFAICTDPFINNSTFAYDQVTGEVSVNPEFDGSSAVFELPIDKGLADPVKADQYLDGLLNGFNTDGISDRASSPNTDPDTDGSSRNPAGKQDGSIDWDTAQPIESTMREIQLDENGYFAYQYDCETGGGNIMFDFNSAFKDSPPVFSTVIQESHSVGPDGETTYGIRVNRDENGIITCVIVIAAQ